MEPIRETVEVANALAASLDVPTFLAGLRDLAEQAQSVVPELVGVSIARLDEGLTFTLLASAEEIAVLDAIQYLAGGPCVDAAQQEGVREFHDGDLLDEARWRLFAEATAARAVLSTLTIPVMADREVTGTVNLYAGARRAFEGHHDELAGIFGAWAPGAVANADLSFATRREAEASAQRVKERWVLDLAAGILAGRMAITIDAAEARIRDAAVRAGVDALAIARTIISADESGAGPQS